MRAVLRVARLELTRRIRNRSALFTAFVGPLALASVFGILLGDTSSISLRIGVVDLDGSEISRSITDGLVGADGDSPVRFRAVGSEQAAAGEIDDDDLDAAIVLPAGFGDAVGAAQGSTITVLGDDRKEVSAGVAASVARQLSMDISARTLAVATTLSLGGAMPTDEQLAALSDELRATVVEGTAGGHEVGAATFFGASMSIMFLFFTVAFAARSLITERKTGVVPRMLAASASPGSIVVGKVIAVGVLGLAGFVTVWLVTTVAFGSHWGSPPAVLATMMLTVAAVAGVATFVCGLARTEEQADGYTSAAAFALALLGGNFLGPGQAPDALRRTASFTPNGQALDALTRIAADGASAADVARQLVLLAAFAVAFGAVGLALVHRQVRR